MENRRAAANPIRVLVVEDNPADADLVRIALDEHEPGKYAIVHVRQLKAAIEQLSRDRTDVVLLDLGLPDADGLETLERIRATRPGTPVVVLTGRADRATGLAAIERGAQAYVLKGWEEPNDLLASIRSAVSRRSALSELASVTDRMRTADERLRKIGPESRAKKA